jgi:putative ABC transport system permease protein
MKPPIDDEVRDEFSFHLELRVRDLIAEGLSPDEARAEAHRRFGNIHSTGAACRALASERDIVMNRASSWEALRQDARFAVRYLWRNPAFALTAIVTLALGIGATTAIFSVVNAVLLRPLPFPEPDRIVSVYSQSPMIARGSTSVGNFYTSLGPTESFATISARSFLSFNVIDEVNAERVVGAQVTPGFFEVFAMSPLHGRVLAASDDVPGRDDVVVLSHRLWTRMFNSEPAAVGRQVRLSGRLRTIVGVMPARFDPTADEEELWVPTAFSVERRQQFDGHFLQVYARLKPGVGDAQLKSDLAQAAARATAADARANQERGFSFVGLREELLGEVPTRLYIWLAAVGFVLLIACGNVANLLLARSAGRGGELAVRAALGAGRGRMVRQLVTESVVLAIVSTVAGLGVALAGIKALVALEPGTIARLSETSIDGMTFAFAVGLSFVCAIVFGLWPAWTQARVSVPASLREAGRGAESGRMSEYWRTGLMVAELAVAMVLLTGAGLMVRSALALQRVDVGFQSAGLWTSRFSLPPDTFAEPARIRQVLDDMQAQVAVLPGVQSVSVTSQIPMGAGGNSNGLVPEGKPFELKYVIDSRFRMVAPGYFETLNIPIREGRAITAADRKGGEKVMVISASLAAQMFPGERAVGKRIACCEAGPDGQSPDYKLVVGVAGDVHWRGPGEPPAPEFYMPLTQVPDDAWGWTQRSMYLVVRMADGAIVPSADVRRIARTLAPGAPLFDERTMEQRLARSQGQLRFNTTLLTILGALGLILAAVGVYGVTTYSVNRRTREIGVRMALGASRGDVLGMVLRRSAIAVGVGLALGLAASWWLGTLITSQLFQVSPTDPVALASAALVFSVVALVASLVPALRAASVDPTTALRAE